MALGAGGMYVGLKRPWLGEEVALQADAGPEIAKEATTSKGKRRKGKRARRPAGDGAADEVPTLSAADRKLVWKGDSVKLPSQQMDFAAEGEGRPLSGAEINQVIQDRSRSMLECVASARGNAPLEATILVKMLVNGDGEVSKMGVRAPAYLFAHGFYECARKAARAMRFPATGGFTVVEAPYDLY